MYHSTHTEVREQLLEISSLLPSCGSWELNSGCQARWRVSILLSSQSLLTCFSQGLGNPGPGDPLEFRPLTTKTWLPAEVLLPLVARILTTRQLVCIHKIIRVVYNHGFAAVTLPSSPTPLMSLFGILAHPLAVSWVNSLKVFAPLLLPGWDLSSHCP